ncbi:alpha/beta hydrolase family protein [Pseudothermotoga sp. U03pept]|uniref:alpha/beta hydrolase family protein n=1 Tax=Pseudothermotoga sp. U03pept TaxID=3447012 RepID=UPI003EFDA263
MFKETSKKRFKILLKYLLLVLTFFLVFTDFGLSLLIVSIVNIPLIRKAVFGRLVLDKVSKPWAKVETFEYMPKRHLDIFYPNTESFKGVILFAHGGGWISGYRRQPNNMSWYRFLVSQGFVVAAIDYSRGYISTIENLVEELTEAVRFMKRKFANLCDVKLSLMGLSAGGHLALLTGLRNPKLVDKIVAYYAPCDLMDIWESESIFARFSVMATIKRLPIKSKELYEKYSPINHVSSLCPKVLLVHGMKDSVVPYAASAKMFVKLKQSKCTVKLLLHPKGDHGFEFVLKDKKTIEILQRTVDFLQS